MKATRTEPEQLFEPVYFNLTQFQQKLFQIFSILSEQVLYLVGRSPIPILV